MVAIGAGADKERTVAGRMVLVGEGAHMRLDQKFRLMRRQAKIEGFEGRFRHG
ncbi:hypothetical protein D3C73_1629060 [compost metagenome]